ncbi:serine- kinase ATM [Paramuricea clavata]|uniref:Serine-protein kinase ATM n=1 Tax=Paramuricea clavata TaxID=317549 RepID=A0A6S7GC85_PARCT|nr:serine- kinase ATM [Paramuricea clavata]
MWREQYYKCLQKLGQSAKLESGLKAAVIELCADICHQLFWFHSETSLMAVDSNKFEGSPSSSKRRKIDVGWNVLRDTLTNSQETPALLGWLQITAKLLSKYPSDLPTKEYVPLLTSLHQLQIECKRQEVISTVMICLKHLAACHVELSEASVEGISSKTTWRNVWLAALRTCSSHGLQDASFQLLECIVKEKLADADTEPWKLLTDVGSNSSEFSLQLVWRYLTTLPLPEHFKVFQNEHSHYPLRHQLFDWLLPPVSKIEQQGYNVCISYSKIFSRLPMDLLSRVLVVLTQRVCYTTNKCVHTLDSKRRTSEQFEKDLEEMENIYILSSFDKRAETNLVDAVTLDEMESLSGDNNTVAELLSYLVQRMIEISQKLLETSDTECSTISSPQGSIRCADKRCEVLARFGSLSTKVLGLLLFLNAWNFKDLTDSPLYLVTMRVLKAVSSGMAESLHHKDEAGKAIAGQSFTATLSDLFLCGFFATNFADRHTILLKPIMKVLRSLTSKELVEYMMQIITKEPRQLNKTRMVVDEFDGTFIDSDEVMDDFETNDNLPSSMSDQKINSDNLSENDKSRISYMKIVSSWCTCLDDGLNESSDLQDNIQNQIFEYFQSTEFDILKPVHSKLFFTAAFILCSGPIQGHVALVIVKNLGISISKYRKDQEYCKEGLRLLTLLATQCGRREAMNDEDMKDAQVRSLHLLKAFWNLRESSYCSSVRLQIAKCMDTFIRFDPDKTLAFFEIQENNNDSSVHISHVFPRLLCDQSLSVRMYMAEAIGILFLKFKSKSLSVPEKPAIQDELLDIVALYLSKSLVVEPDHTKLSESEDEGVNRAASLLSAFKTIVTVSCWCEAKVICLLFQATKEQKLDQEIVAKVIRQISAILGYESTEVFIKTHIGCIIDSWLNHGFKLADFPVQALEFKSLADFLRTHHAAIMPHLIWRFKETESLKTVGREIGNDGDWTEFLVLDFCKIMSIIVPSFAEQGRQKTDSQEPELDQRRAYDCHSFVEKILQKEVTDKLMVVKFDELIVELLLKMHDSPSELPDVSHFIRDYDPPTEQPHFTSHAIKATLDYLTKCHDGSNNTLVSILCKRKENIQKILLRLSEHLEDTSIFHKRRSFLAMYRLFVLLLLQDLNQGLAGTWAFVVRDIVYTIIRTISRHNPRNILRINGLMREGEINIELDNDVFTPSCDLLYQVCKVALSCCPQEIGHHLLDIVNEIIPFVLTKDNRSKKAVALLKFLIVDNKSCLESSISCLDPFPDQPQFAVFNEAYWSVRRNDEYFTLAAEIEHYLSMSGRCRSTSRVEGLRYLRSRFTHHKNDLQEATRVGLDGGLSMRLLKRLVSVKTQRKEVIVEVAKLLAEIGSWRYVSSLNLTMSQDDANFNYSKACEAFKGDEESCRNCRILHVLNDCLIDRDIKKVVAASSCLKDILGKHSIVMLMKCYEEQKIDHLFGYLEPFKPNKRKKKSEKDEVAVKSNLQSFSAIVRDCDLWNPGNFINHTEWISTLTSKIIDSGVVQDEVFQCLSQMCKVHAPFADLVFPYLIHDILLNHGATYREQLSEQIRKIFLSHAHSCSNQSRASTPLITTTGNNDSSEATHDSIHSVLNVINYLRKQPRDVRSGTSGTSWDSNFWLELNYLELAEAALKSSAYCTAILYIEIWRDIHKATSSYSVASGSDTQDVAMEISSESTEESSESNYQNILFEAYASIGEPDAVYGCGVSTELKARIHTYEQEKHWGKALRAYDLYCRQSDNQSCVGTVQALNTFGLDHVTYNYLKGLGDENQNEFLELQYESAWRNRIWNIDKDISDKFTVDNGGFHECVYENIQSLRNKDLKLFDFSLDECRFQIVDELCRTNTESVCEVYPQILRLQCLGELEQARKIHETQEEHRTLLSQWIMDIPESFHELDLLEPILSLRTILLQELLPLSQNDPTAVELRQCLLPALIQHCEMVSKLARHAGCYQISEKSIATLKDIKTGENNLTSSFSWKIEEAKVFWFQGEQETAMHQLKQINVSLKNDAKSSKLLYAQTLGLYGSWLAETRSENPNTIMEKYLDKAVELVESCSDKQESSIEAFLSLARFADSQYKNIQDYMKSWAFENKRSIMNKLKSEVANLKEHGVEKGRYLRELSVQSQSDEQELTQMKEDRLKYLQKAVRNYIRCLQVGGKYDLQIFRICSLWMENSTDDTINKIVEEGVFSQGGKMSVESRKFIPLMYQLAARLEAKTQENGLFQNIMSKLICQAAVEHPYHVIWIILALINADKDSKYLTSGGGKKSGRLSKKSNQQPVDSYIDQDRVKAALHVIENVRKSRSAIVSAMEKLSEAYIELAYYDVSQHKNQTGPLSMPDVTLKRITNLNNVALPTVDIQIDPSCRYENIISISKFEPKYHLCGGINLPKILLCVGSDGIKRRQLIKGKDDLRQDAVMQQVFGMVNTLLQKNVETRKRNLKIRTYKVVPLSQRSGLVEWCEDTTPLGNYLIGGQGKKNLGAHERYYPRDLSSLDCRKKMQVVDRTNVNQKCKVYKEVMSRFHPVFRHFFLEKFPDPSLWFEKRLAYTRSVATASIVGYIVGLGDRHVQNILIDCNTAELIHIDLGVAFEQGKMLPTPETVPFRLTRDLVDGMGVSGVEGVFRRCCQKTMEVMRTSQEALLTIVQVLLFDPLYVWTLSPLKAMSLQRKPDMDASSDVTSSSVLERRDSLDESSVNKMAERVLVRLRQKLDGVEDGTLLSVKGQVNHLIREARDPKNLCRLFPGWQPWI